MTFMKTIFVSILFIFQTKNDEKEIKFLDKQSEEVGFLQNNYLYMYSYRTFPNVIIISMS
jgi:hypothetical protein